MFSCRREGLGLVSSSYASPALQVITHLAWKLLMNCSRDKMLATVALSYIDYCSSEMTRCVPVRKTIFDLDISVGEGDKTYVRETFLMQRSTGPVVFSLFCFAGFRGVFSCTDTYPTYVTDNRLPFHKCLLQAP